MSKVKALGVECESVNSKNIEEVLKSTTTSVLFISVEVLKIPSVLKFLLTYRKQICLKVVDEAHLGKSKILAFYKVLILFFFHLQLLLGAPVLEGKMPFVKLWI